MLNPNLKKNIHWPVRVKHTLLNMGIETIHELEEYTAADLLRSPNFGRKSLTWLTEELKRHNRCLSDRPADYASPFEQLKAENKRLQKLLAQAIERQINPPLVLDELSQEHLDKCCDDAIRFTHKAYRKIFGQLYWKRDLSL